MNTMIECVLLIDDDIATNFYNKRVVNKHSKFNEVVTVNSGLNALKYLIEASKGLFKKPNLIFLDINMPGMDGWEFLYEYEKLDTTITNDIKLIMLTTSTNKDDYNRSLTYDLVNDFINKPLSKNLLNTVIETHYNSYDWKQVI